jgi:hypothetical protein
MGATYVGVSDEVVVTNSNITLVTTGITDLAEGDLLIATISYRGSGDYATNQSGVPTGWTYVTSKSTGNTDVQAETSEVNVLVAYAFYESGLDLTFTKTGTTDVALGALTAFRGVNTGAPFRDWDIVGVTSQQYLYFGSSDGGRSTTAQPGDTVFAAHFGSWPNAASLLSNLKDAGQNSLTTTKILGKTTTTGADCGLGLFRSTSDVVSEGNLYSGSFYLSSTRVDYGFIATLNPNPVDVAGTSQGRTTTTNTTSHAITMPTGIQAGDLLLCVFSVDAAPTVSVNTGVSGDNWKKLGQASYSTTVTGAVFWKIAEGSDALTLTTTSSEQSSHIVYRISGGKSVSGTSANGSSTNSNPPSHTGHNGTEKYLWIATRSGDSTINATVAPSNMGSLVAYAAAGTGGASTAVASVVSEASSFDPSTFTSSSEQWVSWTIAVSASEPPVDLTATSIGTGAPGVGSPALGQVHALTATSVGTAQPGVGSPALGQIKSVASAVSIAASAAVSAGAVRRRSAAISLGGLASAIGGLVTPRSAAISVSASAAAAARKLAARSAAASIAASVSASGAATRRASGAAAVAISAAGGTERTARISAAVAVAISVASQRIAVRRAAIAATATFGASASAGAARVRSASVTLASTVASIGGATRPVSAAVQIAASAAAVAVKRASRTGALAATVSASASGDATRRAGGIVAASISATAAWIRIRPAGSAVAISATASASSRPTRGASATAGLVLSVAASATVLGGATAAGVASVAVAASLSALRTRRSAAAVAISASAASGRARTARISAAPTITASVALAADRIRLRSAAAAASASASVAARATRPRSAQAAFSVAASCGRIKTVRASGAANVALGAAIVAGAVRSRSCGAALSVSGVAKGGGIRPVSAAAPLLIGGSVGGVRIRFVGAPAAVVVSASAETRRTARASCEAQLGVDAVASTARTARRGAAVSFDLSINAETTSGIIRSGSAEVAVLAALSCYRHPAGWPYVLADVSEIVSVRLDVGIADTVAADIEAVDGLTLDLSRDRIEAELSKRGNLFLSVSEVRR